MESKSIALPLGYFPESNLVLALMKLHYASSEKKKSNKRLQRGYCQKREKLEYEFVIL